MLDIWLINAFSYAEFIISWKARFKRIKRIALNAFSISFFSNVYQSVIYVVPFPKDFRCLYYIKYF